MKRENKSSYSLVSICIPTFNRINFLKEAIQSAQNQTYQNIEIIISDNSQDDITRNYIKTVDDKRIRYYKNSKNIGSFANLKKVASLAKGKYIKFLLDDDILKPTCVEKMLKAFEAHPKIGIVMAPLEIIDKNGLISQPKFYIFRKMKYLYKYRNQDSYIKKEEIMNDFLTTTYPCCVPTGIMFRKSLFDDVGGFDKKYRYIGDLDLCMNLATKMDFYYINEFLASWRYSNTSETISILHKKGIELDIFYTLTKKYLFFTNLKKEAFFFASKRTAINIIAGIQSRNLTLIFKTIKTIMNNDPYLSNKIYLPINLFSEAFKSFF